MKKTKLVYVRPNLRKLSALGTCGCATGSGAGGFTAAGTLDDLCNAGGAVPSPPGPGYSYCSLGTGAEKPDVYCYAGAGATEAGCVTGSGDAAAIRDFDDCVTGTIISATTACEIGNSPV